MAIHTKIFNFDVNAEGWLSTPQAPMTMGYEAGLIFAELAEGAHDTTGYWRWNGNFSDLGVPAASTINSIRVSFDYNLTILNRGIAGTTSFNIDVTNYISTLRETTDVVGGTRTSIFESVVYDYADSIELEIPLRLETTGQNPAGNRFVRVELLEIRVEVDHDPPLPVIDAVVTITNAAQTVSVEGNIVVVENFNLLTRSGSLINKGAGLLVRNI